MDEIGRWTESQRPNALSGVPARGSGKLWSLTAGRAPDSHYLGQKSVEMVEVELGTVRREVGSHLSSRGEGRYIVDEISVLVDLVACRLG